MLPNRTCFRSALAASKSGCLVGPVDERRKDSTQPQPRGRAALKRKHRPAAFVLPRFSSAVISLQLRRATRRGRCAPHTLTLLSHARNFYLHGAHEPSLRMAINALVRRPWKERCVGALLQAQLLATEFALVDRLQALGTAQPDNPSRCAKPIIIGLLQYEELRHGLVDANNREGLSPAAERLINIGERRIMLAFRTLWTRLLDAQKTWGAAVGSLGFCDCSVESRTQIDVAIDALRMRDTDFPIRIADANSYLVTILKNMRGCEKIFFFSVDTEEAAEVRLRPFTTPGAGERFGCTPLTAAFAAICAQYYIVIGMPFATRGALRFAAELTMLGGDCGASEGSSTEPPLRPVDILYNYARAQRLASHVEAGAAAPSALAWRASQLTVATMSMTSVAEPLDDSVPRNFPGSSNGRQPTTASDSGGSAHSWICDLGQCREHLPRFLAGTMQRTRSATEDPVTARQMASAQERLAQLSKFEAQAPRSDCHRFRDDDFRFCEQRIEALSLGTALGRCAHAGRPPTLSSWSPNGLFQTRVPEHATWKVSSLVPLPWVVMHTFSEQRRATLEERWQPFSLNSAGRRKLNTTTEAAGRQVEGIQLRVSGLDLTRCTVHIEVHVRAHRLDPELLEARAARRENLVNVNKLLNFVIVVMDSTSAPAWDIFAPEVMAELASAKGDASTTHEAFRFHGYHSLIDPDCDCLTQDNMMTFFGGQRPSHAAAQGRRVADSAIRFAGALRGWRWLWHELQAAGYVTLSADDSCSRSPLNVADPEYDWFDTYAPTLAHGPDECSEDVFCRHREILDYAAQWLALHARLPHLAYLHFDGTHGTRPEVLVRYDSQLADWIRSRLQAPGSDRTAIIIMSDHGVQAGDGHLTAQPFLAAWLPRQLLNSLGREVIEALRGNARRLLTPFDAHFTLQQLFQAGLARAQGVSPTLVSERPPFAAQVSQRHVVRSALFPLPADRDCADAGLAAAYCFCAGSGRPWQGFGSNETVLRHLALSLVEMVNYRARLSLLGDTKDLSACRLQTLASIEASRERSDGSIAEFIITTSPSGLVWKGVARRSLANGESEGTSKTVDGDEGNGGDSRLEVVSAEQITRYFPHESCTPAGVDPKFCACNPLVAHRLAQHDRFWTSWQH